MFKTVMLTLYLIQEKSEHFPAVVKTTSVIWHWHGGSPKFIIGGKKCKEYTAFDMSTTPPTLVRRDFALEDLRQLGAKLPEMYFDELGNLRNNNDELVMQGPNNNVTQ
jgi:hypothetical protein